MALVIKKIQCSSLYQRIDIYTCRDDSVIHGSLMTVNASSDMDVRVIVYILLMMWVSSSYPPSCDIDPYDFGQCGIGGMLSIELAILSLKTYSAHAP